MVWSVYVVCEWIGNSQPIAAKHYLQVTDEHFQEAVQKTSQYTAQQAAVGGRNDSQEGMPDNAEYAICGPERKDATPCGCKELHQVTPRGFEPRLQA